MTSAAQPATADQQLTLAQLVNEPGLGLNTVVPGDLAQVVLGAHAIEIDHPAQWLRPGTIMLTTGLRFVDLADGASDWRRLIDELDDAGVSALLFGIGVHFEHPPTELLDAATEREFTLITIDGDTPFHIIEDFVNRSVLSAQTRLLNRALRLHEDLLRTLATDDPVSALIRRLSLLCKGSALLYDSGGHAIAADGEAPQRLIWQEIEERGDGSHAFSIGRWFVRTHSITLSGAQLHVAIAARNRALLDELGETILTTTAHILAAANGIRSVTMTHQRSEARRLLGALEAGVQTSRVGQTWGRLRPFGLRPGESMRYLIATPLDGADRRTARRPSDAVAEAARKAGIGLLMCEEAPDETTASRITALVRAADPLDDWLEGFGATHLVGLSCEFSDLTVVPSRIKEAVAAARLVHSRHEKGGQRTVLRMDDVDLASWVIARNDSSELRGMMLRQLAALDDAPDIRTTVVHYLAFDQDLRRTADALFVHVNTVRYRLQRAEQLLGAKLASVALIANLYLVLQDEVTALAAQLNES